MSEQIAEMIDQLENLIGALELPLKPQMHIDQLRRALPEVVRKLKEAYVHEFDDNPWNDLRGRGARAMSAPSDTVNYSTTQVEAFVKGVWLFAHWKDGVQYVGTSGTTYKEVLLNPAKHMERAGVVPEPPPEVLRCQSKFYWQVVTDDGYGWWLCEHAIDID